MLMKSPIRPGIKYIFLYNFEMQGMQSIILWCSELEADLGLGVNPER